MNDDLANLLAAAVSVLRGAVETNHEAIDGARNRRRIELIKKSVRAELTNAEQSELDQLQQELDRKFESFDRGLQYTAAEMRAAVEDND